MSKQNNTSGTMDANQISANPAKNKKFSGAKPSKNDLLRSLVTRRNGATTSQLEQQLGWQPHTIRAAISRLRKTGIVVELDKSGSAPRYRATSVGDAA